MRTVAGKRPAEPEITTYTDLEARDELIRRGFDRDHANRIIAIAQWIGIKGECIPGGGVVTVKALQRSRLTIHDKLFI